MAYYTFGGGLRISSQEHREILRAIERGDCEAALENHILGGRDRLLRAMSATGQLAFCSTGTTAAMRPRPPRVKPRAFAGASAARVIPQGSASR